MATSRPKPLHAPLGPIDPTALVAQVAARPSAAILESVSGAGGRPGRWTVLAYDPCFVFEATGDQWRLLDANGTMIEAGKCDPLRMMNRLVDRYDPHHDETGDPDLPPFRGGWIGYLGYDLAPRIERLPRRAPTDSLMPDIRFALHDHCVTIDHEAGEISAWGQDFRGKPAQERSEAFEGFVAQIREGTTPTPDPAIGIVMQSNVDRDEYLRAVGKALDYIRAGDIFQVNLSQRFEGRGHVDPATLYRNLAQRSPAAYSALLRWGDNAIVSASPECFYETRGNRIITRPIKGTRPRGATPSEDSGLADELRRSAKDRAELTMIVDLERNDLGRVCTYGSVRVTEPLEVETFAQVHHLVATVEGELRPEVGPIDVIRAMFPGGSITGAPKIRAMEIIDELEPTRRSVYTGAIGFISQQATSFNIAIRTVLIEGERVSYQVGGGIVADSDPSSEYEETLHKGRGLRNVLENPGARP